MSDAERRRSTDPWLEKLFDQSERQHAQNRSDFKEMSGLLHALAMKDQDHNVRLTTLEIWREKTADPWISQTKDGFNQAKGVGKMAKLLYTLGGVVGGGALYKFGAAIIAALPK